MPKLLQINVTANWGSTGKIAEQIGLVAMQHGWESYIAYGRKKNPSKSKLIKIGNLWDVYLHYAVSRFFDLEGLMSKKATKKLVKEIERINPDIIHLHNIHDHYLNYSLLFNYLAGKRIPVVWTQHDLWAVTGGCCYTFDGCERWKVCCGPCVLRKGIKLDQSKKNFLLKRELFSSLKSLTLVPVSNWLGGILNDSFLGGNNIQIIHNGIDINIFSPLEVVVYKRLQLEGKKIVLGVASEWSERKGLRDFFRLSEILPREEYAIVVVGKVLDGKTNVNLEGCNMVFIPRTQNVLELAQLYSAAIVFVNPTYQDNYPTTNLEAMACGTPVITYRTGGSPEAVTSETGWIVEQGDVEGIVAIIKSLELKDYSELLSQRKACRERAEKEFDKDKCFDKYLDLYEKLLGKR